MRREEDFQRSKNTLAGQVPLINVYKQQETFKCAAFPEDRLCLSSASPYCIIDEGIIGAYERYFPRGGNVNSQRKELTWPKRKLGINSVVSKDQFLKQFAIFTENQLKGIDWNNVFVAGGNKSNYQS
jgi:hypothetical protein